MMTISQFSEETGLRPKTLRYYEEVGVLVPRLRLENGYRQYVASQIEEAQLIHSLRQADMSLSEIREFLSADPELRKELLFQWRKKVATKLLSIQVASQFLQGFNLHKNYIQLVHWDHCKKMIWYPFPSESVPLGQVMKSYRKQLQLQKLKVENSGYIRFSEYQEGYHGEIGFCHF